MRHLFMNLSAGKKLLVSFGFIIGLLVLLTIMTTLGINNIKRGFDLAMNATEFRNNVNEQRLNTLMILSTTDKTEQEATKQDIAQLKKENDSLLNRINSYGQNNELLSQAIQQLSKMRQAFNHMRDNQVIPLLLAGKTEEAKSILLGVQTQNYQDLVKINDKIVNIAREGSYAEIRNLTWSFVSVLLLILLSAVLSIRFLTKSLAEPLQAISVVSNQIAQGNLSSNITVLDRQDEIGILTQSFYQMTQALQSVAAVAKQISEGNLTVNIKPQSEQDVLGKALSLMVKNLRKLTADVKEAVTVVSSATVEISTSANQLVTSASETAAAVSETTGTIEEVRQTAQHSNQKAQTVVESSQKTTEVALLGKAATEESAAGINRIGEQMQVIAQSMQRLSEQSQMIGDILTTVDDLAQQSNLLAVNAAIEAAKAGEQGKGFAVVAQEIKALAEQSKQATQQVRTVLGDIQKATGVAVMATEQGTKVVELGRQKSSEAGESIHVLASSVMEAAEAVTQIATISHQQLSGVEQAATAMENIREASNQNVETTRQLDGAIQNLKELGTRMQQLISCYQLES